MSAGRLGMTVVTDDNDKVVGVFTDGDLRRGSRKRYRSTNANALK